jgi:pyrroline-5-carboxylate reductase
LNLGAIGAGHMGGAILRAVLDGGLVPPERVHISSPVPEELEPFAAAGCGTSPGNLETARFSDLILLAVRPAQVKTVIAEIAAETAGKCVLSIAAGVSIASIKEMLPQSASVLRAMPSLPVAYGLGATVMAAPHDTPVRFVAMANAIFECGGTVETIEEDCINAATALGGSAVAYFFRMASIMQVWAEENGISSDTALRIAAQTMRGGAEMLTKSGKTPKELADSVAVPGGMTEAAFRAFDREGFDRALKAGMESCRNRGIELVLSS